MDVRINWGVFGIATIDFESKNEMLDALSQCKNGYFLMDEPDWHDCYTVLEYQKFGVDDKFFGIGLFYMSVSSPPSLIFSQKDYILFVGCNNTFLAFDLSENKIVFSLDLHDEFVFGKIVGDSILIICELKVVQITYGGEKIKEMFFHDMLETFTFNNNKALFNTCNEQYIMDLNKKNFVLRRFRKR